MGMGDPSFQKTSFSQTDPTTRARGSDIYNDARRSRGSLTNMTPGMRGAQDYLYNRVFGPSGTSAYSYRNPYNAPTGGPSPSNMGPLGPLPDGDQVDVYGGDIGGLTTNPNLGLGGGGNSYGHVPTAQLGVPSAITAVENLFNEDVDAMTKYQHQLNDENYGKNLNFLRDRQAGMGAWGSRADLDDLGAMDDFANRQAMINANAEQNYLQNQMKIAETLGGLDQTYGNMLRQLGIDQQVLQGSELDELTKMYNLRGTPGTEFYSQRPGLLNNLWSGAQSALALAGKGLDFKERWDEMGNPKPSNDPTRWGNI